MHSAQLGTIRSHDCYAFIAGSPGWSTPYSLEVSADKLGMHSPGPTQLLEATHILRANSVTAAWDHAVSRRTTRFDETRHCALGRTIRRNIADQGTVTPTTLLTARETPLDVAPSIITEPWSTFVLITPWPYSFWWSRIQPGVAGPGFADSSLDRD